MTRKRKSQKGFTLLEALVALSIFASSTVALYSWYNTVLLGLTRAEYRLEVIDFSRNYHAYLGMLNLQGETSGEYAANGLVAKWSAKLVEPKKEGRTVIGVIGYYRIGLYDVHATIVREIDDQELDQMVTRLVGYEGVRVPRVDINGR